MKKIKSHIAIKLIAFLLLVVLVQSLLAFATLPAKSYTRLLFHEFYNEDAPIDVVFVGTSRYYRGVNTDIIDTGLGVNCYNFGTSQQGMIDSYYVLEEIYNTQTPELVVLDVTWRRLYETAVAMPTNIIINYMQHSERKLNYARSIYKADTVLQFLMPGLQNPNTLLSADLLSNIKLKFSPEYRNYDAAVAKYKDEWYSSKGFVYSTKAFEDGNIGELELDNAWDKALVDDASLDYLDQCIRLCQEKGSKVVCIGAPTTAATLATAGNYSDYVRFIEAQLDEYGIEYYDFSLARPELYMARDSYYYDEVHLNGAGADAFSAALVQVLATFEQSDFDESRYFYPSFEEMAQAAPRVLNTWLKFDKADGQVEAFSQTGGEFEVEYEFFYRAEGDSQFTALGDAGTQGRQDLSALQAGKYVIRVEARVSGHLGDCDQWDELSVHI